jgi:hypothetical protein
MSEENVEAVRVAVPLAGVGVSELGRGGPGVALLDAPNELAL